VIVMPANNSNAHKLELVFPGRLGLLFSPSGKRDPKKLTFGMDNEMYSAWVKSGFAGTMVEIRKHWDEGKFLAMCEWAFENLFRPRWLVVPDVCGNALETLRQFEIWRPRLERFGWTLAIAAQDGMSPSDIPEGVVTFLGGSTEWKWGNVERFGAECERLHVGRVNQYKRFWQCHDAGAESCDGSGIFRGDQRQFRGFIQYLKESSGVSKRRKQKRLFK
jgi:hypothetical protein